MKMMYKYNTNTNANKRKYNYKYNYTYKVRVQCDETPTDPPVAGLFASGPSVGHESPRGLFSKAPLPLLHLRSNTTYDEEI
jgi:hypothetical protein